MCKKIVVAVCVLLFLSLSIIACGEKKKMEAENRRNSYGTQSDPDRRRKM